jgi:putative nucleotidyltransferase with HDIG domain
VVKPAGNVRLNADTDDIRSDAPSAADHVLRARERDRAGAVDEAIAEYKAAIVRAEETGAVQVLAEALRRLAVIRYQRNEHMLARSLCQRSYEVACQIDSAFLAGEALNTLGVMQLKAGALDDARATLYTARDRGGMHPELQARIEQNLGIIANIRGEYGEAHRHFMRALADYQTVNDEYGCGMALHSLGMVSADLGELEKAEEHFCNSLDIYRRSDNMPAQAYCLMSLSEKVYLPRQRFEEARRNAESALAIFDQFGDRDSKGSAYRVLGIVFRETGKHALAESRFEAAISQAADAHSLLHEAEATRELAVLYQAMGRNQEALALLNRAHGLFQHMSARQRVEVARQVDHLEQTYIALVMEWGRSIESSDSYTFGHCERVARRAVGLAIALGLDSTQQTTIRLGAYLHDLGKVKVPHEILNKSGPLTPEEREVVQSHPMWGIRLLAQVDFPWDIKPIIRWHHEKCDGSGYPDRLRADEIPLEAQIVGIVDVFDALTTTRAYRPAFDDETAIAELTRCRAWWSPDVFDAFISMLRTMQAASQLQGPGRSASVV